MTYDSLDKIPLKLYMEILRTGNLTLLSDEKDKIGHLTEIWEKLKADFKIMDPDNDFDKTLKAMIKVEKLSAKYKFLEYAVECLKYTRDEELENMVRELKYKLRETHFDEDLKLVDAYRKGILIQIEKASTKLPKPSGSRPTGMDEVILGYCTILNLSYDTNLITVTQFYAMKKVFDVKLKAAKQEAAKRKQKGPKTKRHR